MGTKKVFPLLISMAVPPMISMMIQSLYNIVDSMFAARLGVNAITAISLAYPLQNLILSSRCSGLGVGINACIAMVHGTRGYQKSRSGSCPRTGADRYFMHWFLSLPPPGNPCVSSNVYKGPGSPFPERPVCIFVVLLLPVHLFM